MKYCLFIISGFVLFVMFVIAFSHKAIKTRRTLLSLNSPRVIQPADVPKDRRKDFCSMCCITGELGKATNHEFHNAFS